MNKVNIVDFTIILEPYKKVYRPNEGGTKLVLILPSTCRLKTAAEIISLNLGIRDVYWMLRLFEDILTLWLTSGTTVLSFPPTHLGATLEKEPCDNIERP